MSGKTKRNNLQTLHGFRDGNQEKSTIMCRFAFHRPNQSCNTLNRPWSRRSFPQEVANIPAEQIPRPSQHLALKLNAHPLLVVCSANAYIQAWIPNSKARLAFACTIIDVGVVQGKHGIPKGCFQTHELHQPQARRRQ